MVASSKTARKAAEWGNGMITSADSSGFAGSVLRTDPRLESAARPGADLGPIERTLCAGRVCVVHPLTRPFAHGTRMDCNAFGARGVCPNETSRGQSVVIVEMERILRWIS